MGYVYLVGEPNKFGPVKIGWASDPHKRLQSLLTGMPFEGELLAFKAAPSNFEEYLHRVFEDRRIHREWFKDDDGVIRGHFQAICPPLVLREQIVKRRRKRTMSTKVVFIPPAPCDAGHTGPRYLSTRACVECERAATKARRAAKKRPA